MKIAVLLSGGVDSSVALQLLKNEDKHEITAFYLKIWLEDELHFLGECPWQEDLGYVQAICEQLDIPLEIVNLQQQYQERVVEYVLAELRCGRTPSPDILCNQMIKFGAFFDNIDDSYDKVATGHYAQIEEVEDKFLLKRAPDPVKDQTYFLASLNQEQLSRALFPIGHLEKNEVRELAEQFDLPTKARKDSQGICFLGKIKYNDFVKFHLGEKPGDIVELETDEKKGEHNGVWFHTIGQRQGLGLHGGPWYVVQKDLEKNIVYISHKKADMNRETDSFTASNIHWISNPAEEGVKYEAKLRHGPNLVGFSFKFLSAEKIEVTMDESDKGVAAGQSIIIYDNLICLGRAVID